MKGERWHRMPGGALWLPFCLPFAGGIARVGAVDAWPWCTRPWGSALPSVRVQNVMPRCPGVGFPFPPHPTGMGCPHFAWPRAPRLPGEGVTGPGAGGHPQAEGPGAARRAGHSPPRTPLPPAPAGGAPLPPQPHRELLLPPTPPSAPGLAPSRGGCGDSHPRVSPPCPRRAAAGAQQQQQHPQPRRAQHRPGSLKVKRGRRGKPRCPPQTPHLPPARPLTVLEVTPAAAGWAGGSELR